MQYAEQERQFGGPEPTRPFFSHSMSRDLPTIPSDPFWRSLTLAVIAALAVAIGLTFRNYGISWDEAVQNTYGVDLLNFYTSDLRDRAALSYMNLYYYGGFFDLVAAILNRISPFGVYETRHLWGGVVFLVGLVAAARLGTLLAGARAGFFAVAVLGINALLYGHGFINPKDTPLAWLALWTIYFAVRAIVEGNPRTSTLIGFAISAGLTVGTRIIGLFILGAIAGGIILGMIAHRYRATNPPMGRAALGLVAALPLAYAVMAVFWPWAIQDPFNPIAALREFSHMPSQGLVRWEGEMVPTTHVPRSYLLELLLIQLPEYLLAGLVPAAIAGAVLLGRRRLDLLADRRTIPVLILIATAVAPIVGFMVMRPMAYNAMRHFLFLIPPLGILAALGWDVALDFAQAQGRAVAASVLALFALCCVNSVHTMVRLHPYEYLGYNSLVGGLRGANGRFELDYWDVSYAEAARKFAAYLGDTGQASATVYVCGSRESATEFLPATVRYTYALEEADYLISNAPNSCDYLPVDQSRDHVVEVKREGVVLSYVVDLRAQRGAR